MSTYVNPGSKSTWLIDVNRPGLKNFPAILGFPGVAPYYPQNPGLMGMQKGTQLGMMHNAALQSPTPISLNDQVKQAVECDIEGKVDVV